MDDFLKGVIGFSVLIVMAGIVGSAANNSEKAFDLSPYFNFIRRFRREKTASFTPTQYSTSHREIPLEVASPEGIDPRLSICPIEAIDGTIGELSITKANIVRQAMKNGLQFKTLTELQTSLGKPNCNFLKEKTRQYRYLVIEGKIIDGLQQEQVPEVVMIFTNF
ncbi:MAG: hypothetical protein AAGA60_26240 [Cyanobacteria bacterium P01_E01_bin.42]